MKMQKICRIALIFGASFLVILPVAAVETDGGDLFVFNWEYDLIEPAAKELRQVATVVTVGDKLSIIGWEYDLIEVAVKELRKKGLSPSAYEIILQRVEFGFAVVFMDPNTKAGQMGSSPAMPAFIVELDSKQMVLRTSFRR